MISSLSAKPVLILGCGYLGSKVLSRLQKRVIPCDALTRNPQGAESVKHLGARKIVCAHLDSDSWHKEFDPNAYGTVVISVGSAANSSAGYEQSYIHGIKSFLNWANDFKGRVIYTSSISVYGEQSCGFIDESTAPNPASWRGSVIVESEKLLQSFPELVVLRLGGIYGLERSRTLVSISSSNPQQMLNMIHVQDAASAIDKIIDSEQWTPGIYNLTDNHPTQRKTLNQAIHSYYESLGTSAPVLETTSQRSSRCLKRQIKAEKIQKTYEWSPIFASVIQALPSIIKSNIKTD